MALEKELGNKPSSFSSVKSNLSVRLKGEKPCLSQGGGGVSQVFEMCKNQEYLYPDFIVHQVRVCNVMVMLIIY